MPALALVLPWLGVQPAQAHVPSVLLLLLAPKDGQTVTANPAVVIYAQRMLLGADQTTYTIALDQRPSDPANGPSLASPPRSALASNCACLPAAGLPVVPVGVGAAVATAVVAATAW